MSDVARYYDEGKQDNPNNPASIPGVPLTDLDQATFEALPEHLQRDVDKSPLYRKTKPSGRARVVETPDAPAEKETT